MPELPEVETIRRGLERTVAGKTIESVDVLLPKIISIGPKTVSNVRKSSAKNVKIFENLLRGRKIQSLRRRAKMLIFDLSGGLVMLVHLKMTGQFIFVKKGENKQVKVSNSPNSSMMPLPHKYTHATFRFVGGSKLYFNDLRQFGYLKLVKDEEIGLVKELADFGPEPLSRDFSFEHFSSAAKKRPGLSIKQFLSEQRAVAGIGNIYSDEILFDSKIRPTRRMRSLSRGELRAIFKSIPKILNRAVGAQGSSVGDFFKVDGSEGGFGRQHKVYQRYGQACFDCGETIQKVKLGGRTASFCPHCQR